MSSGRPWLRRRVHAALMVSSALGCMALGFALPGSVGRAQAAEEESPPTARIDSYNKPSGESYFALQLPAVPAAESEASPQAINLLVDTSASQAGDYRVRVLETVSAIIGAIRDVDRVRLVAVDVSPVPLTEEFVAAESAEMESALTKLRHRVPLGATDLSAAMEESLSIAAPKGSARSIIYLGDGINIGGSLDSTELSRLCRLLVDARMSVSSLSIGPRNDAGLLAAFANQTGGVLAIDGTKVEPLTVGRWLAASLREVVAWPIDSRLPDSLGEVLPKRVPPMRSDRETVLVGTGRIEDAVDVVVRAEVRGKEQEYRWPVSRIEASVENSYLAPLVESARADGGARLMTLGLPGLVESKRMIAARGQELEELGKLATLTGDRESAERLNRGARKLDPSTDVEERTDAVKAKPARAANTKPASSKAAPARKPAAKSGAARGSSVFRFVADRPKRAADDPLANQGSLLDDVERQRRVITEKVKQEVHVGLSRLRGQMEGDPEMVKQELERLRLLVSGVAELDADDRANMLNQIEAAQRQTAAVRVRVDERRRVLAEIQSRQTVEIRLIQDLDKRASQLNQLMAKFDSLMAEERYDDAEAVAFLARDLDPRGTTPVVAVFGSRMQGYVTEAYRLREARQRGMVEMLASVERSFVPISDEPPILYPAPEVWQALTERRAKYKVIDLASTGEREKKILAALDETTDLSGIDEMPLEEFIQLVAQKHGIQIIPDKNALGEANVDLAATAVTANIKGIKLKSALKIILKGLETPLSYIIEDEVLKITTQEVAGSRLITKVYPVADLVFPVPMPQQIGGIGGLGGGGGQGGGGFGGGGGQGGGGGGFGGGGGGGQFDVKDGIRIKDQPVPQAAQPAGPAGANAAPAGANAGAARRAAPKKIEVIRLSLAEGETPASAWDAYFAEHSDPAVEPNVVRETVRRLAHDKQFDHVVALCEAALRHGQGQPWMYEAMGLALQASGAAADSIERTLLSAADLGTDAVDLLYIAWYLAKSGYDARALRLFQQVSRHQPARAEPYQHGLACAQRLNDIAGVRWATVGILSQGWPKSQSAVFELARRTALGEIEKLETSGQLEEAAEFRAAVESALQRDLIIQVSWNGEADIDMSVTEPGGSICSLTNLRTIGGGVMDGDDAIVAAGTRPEGGVETYACPKAFEGAYQISIRRIWGKIPSGKVTLDVYTQYGTPQQTRRQMQVPVGAKDVVVNYELAQGRREEALAQHQVEVAAANQFAVGREILRRQLAALGNNATFDDFIQAQGRQRNIARNALGRAGAVGYMPIIIVLPSGATLNVRQAIISPDRRYVRVSPSPQFTQITKVDTFTFDGTAPAGQGQQGQNGGGQGQF